MPLPLFAGPGYEVECLAERLSYDRVAGVFSATAMHRDGVGKGPGGVNRCEIATWRRPLKAGKTFTSSFDLRVAPGPALDRGKDGWVVLHQWKGITAKGTNGGAAAGPVLSLELGGPKLDTLRIVSRRIDTMTSPAAYRLLWQAPRPIVRGQWIRVAEEALFNIRGCSVRVRIDGKPVLNAKGLDCGQGDAVSYYAKYGVYRSDMIQPLRVDYRRIRDGVAR